MQRIAKFLSIQSVASRRVAEKMIAEGRVAVNGKTIDTPATLVGETDIIKIDGKPVTYHLSPVTKIYLFHKPTGCICSTSDPSGRKTIYDVLPKVYRNLKYIGRLDYNTSGLLLMTNDGELARKMTLPESKIERTYVAKVGGAWTMDDATFARITRPAKIGIKIDGIIYRPMKIERIDATDVKITITEGKKNEIRIVFAHLKLPIRKLHRISYGKYKLNTLPAGKIVMSLALPLSFPRTLVSSAGIGLNKSAQSATLTNN